MKRIKFLDSPVDSVDIPDVLEWMSDRIETNDPGLMAVVNANKFWLMSRDTRLRKIVNNADLVIPEWSVVWGASWLGTPLKSYVAGVALLQAAMPWAEKKGYRPYFLGASQNVIEILSNQLKSEFPKLNPAGFHNGFLITESDYQKVREEINNSRPDMIFVAMGSPKQEYWIEENAKLLQIPVSLGVGGSFDVLAGIKKDTPAWARGNGMEWAYRLAQEPKAYWRRYLMCNPWFVNKVIKAYFCEKLLKLT